MRKIIKNFFPPVALETIKYLKRSKYGWKGDYQSWELAEEASKGYDTEEIFKKVMESSLKVKRGEAIYERDSVIFDKIQYSWPLLAGVMFAANLEKRVSILDFGGSLGTSYFSNKKFLDKIENVS